MWTLQEQKPSLQKLPVGKQLINADFKISLYRFRGKP